MGVKQCIAQVRLQQLRFVYFGILISYYFSDFSHFYPNSPGLLVATRYATE